jgi:hypothetical protein
MPDWRPAPPPKTHPDALCETLHAPDGQIVAFLEARDVAGPYYADAKTPDGIWRHSGGFGDWAAIRDWCERHAGLKPNRDLTGWVRDQDWIEP